MKKLASLLLAVTILLSLALPAGAAFQDVTDSETAREVAVLQMMGVINGTSATTFSPNGPLTRAQFCKMAVIVLGRGDEEPLYRNRTIFPDVLSNHWARGYINLAVSVTIGGSEDGTGATQLIRGMGDGTFRPDRNITYAEAVTILLRMLGYSDLDAGMNWPNGYLELAANIGLTSGMNLSANQSLTRAQAAHLFNALLLADQKSGSPYYNQLGTPETGVVLTNANAEAEDGTTGAMGTSDGVYKTVTGIVPPELVGSRGVLVKDSGGRARAFLPTGRQETVVVDTAQAAYLTDRSGNRYTLTDSTPTYTTTASSTYKDTWMELRCGAQVTLYFSEGGQVEGLYRSTVSADTAMVARTSSGNPFAALVEGASDYTVYRDGSPATVSDIALYDVGTYDPVSRILSVSSAKITGRYDDVSPNLQSPQTVTVMGAELPVMPMAIDDLAKFDLGDTFTLLLTSDGQVAGAVSTQDCRADNLGVVNDNGVMLLNGIQVSGSDSDFDKGHLVRVSSSGANKVSLSRVSGSGGRGTLNVAERTVGDTAVNGSCRIFEQAGDGAVMREISWDDLLVETVPASQITYARRDAKGRVDLMILNDVTGDMYTYGIIRQGEPQPGGQGTTMAYENRTVELRNKDHSSTPIRLISNMSLPKNRMAGLVAGDGGSLGMDKVVASVSLIEQEGIRRSDFTTRDGVTYVLVRSQEMVVSEDVQCYNRRTGTWFDSLDEARAFSDDLTVYYDRPAEDGGKVRIVVAE